MTSLSPEQIRHLIRLMDDRHVREVQEIDAIEARIRAQREDAPPSADWKEAAAMDASSQADAALVRQNRQDVRDILAARERLASGTYGICIDCGGAIGYQRLLAYPTAKRCITCQRRHEARGEQRQAG